MTAPAVVLDLADSEAASVRAEGDALVLRLAAAQVVRGSEVGYLLGVDLRFEGARWQGDLAACIGRIRSAHLVVQGQHRTRLALPFTVATVQAGILFQNDEPLQVEADALRIDPEGAQFVASYAC